METTAEATITNGVPKTKSGLPLYIEYRNKDGMSIKVINFNNPDICPNYGVVEYEAVKKKDFERNRDTHFMCPATYDKSTDIYYGDFNGFTASGEPKWKRFPLGMINVFDRSIPADAKKALIMSKSSIVEGSPNLVQNIKLHLFRLVDLEEAATKEIIKIKDSQRAISLASQMYGKNLLNMAMLLGLPTENMTSLQIEAKVLKSAQENPKAFLDAYDNPNREIIITFACALETQVITQDPNLGYKYEGVVIGQTYDLAIKFLIDNIDVRTMIDVKAQERLSAAKKAMAGVKENKISKTKEELEIEELKLKLAQKEAELNRVKVDGIKESFSPLEIELGELLKEAQALKLKGLHNYKPTQEAIDKLKARIEEAKNK